MAVSAKVRGQVLTLLAGRHDAVEAAQGLVQALGVEALVVAADGGAVLSHWDAGSMLFHFST